MKIDRLLELSVLAAVCMASLPALADELNYNFVEVAYIDTELDDINVDGDGFGVSGSMEVSDSIFITASYAAQDFDFGIDLNEWQIGIGGHMPLSDTLDLVGSLAYVSADIDAGVASADDDGIGIGVGVRASFGEAVQLEGGLNYVDLDDSGDDTTIGGAVRYYFSRELAVGLSVDIGDDATTWAIGARLEF